MTKLGPLPLETLSHDVPTLRPPDMVGPQLPETAKKCKTRRPDETVPKILEVGGTALPCVPGYEILGVLGRGSMGIVYKARQIGLKRLVALKMIRPDNQFGPEDLQRFITEARVVASMRHHNIVQIYDINLEHKSPYFSMELMEGGTLADQLGGRPQPFREAAQFILTLARALHSVHQQGVIHRDLKPANILMAAPSSRASHFMMILDDVQPLDLYIGTPKITDFGLAKELYGDASQTESGIVLGTPSYMAPEQAEGKSRDAGPGSDIYALGAIFYEMLTGRPPFTAQSRMETIMLLFQADPVAPSALQPKLPRDLETICLKCLHKNPQRRYASAEDLADDLQRFLAGEPISARPVSLRERAWKWTRRRPVLATTLAGLLLASASLLGLTGWHHVELQSRLGQALADERETRIAQEAAAEGERVGLVRERVKELLHAGEGALQSHDWKEAELQLARARDQAEPEPALTDVHTRIEKLLEQTRRQRLDQERLEAFMLRRNEALFHATLFTGGNRTLTLHHTRTAATQALALFGIKPGDQAKPQVESPYYSVPQKADIATGCYELLIVLADATAHSQSENAGDKRRHAEEALRILETAADWGVTTQAYHRRRAQYLVLAEQKEAAEKERRRANALRPASALDHFLLGHEHYAQGDSPLAATAFENVLQVQPDHFWGSYYLALCRLKMQRPEQAVACLTACLAQRREFPWLYLLRGSAWGEMAQFDRAEDDFEKALNGSLPDSARYGLLINRGVMRVRAGKLDGALVDLRQAIALQPRDFQGYVNLAQAHLKGQQLAEAITQMDEAIRLEPHLGGLYRTRARLHLLAKDQAAALADFDHALRHDSNASDSVKADDHLERSQLLRLQNDLPAALSACDDALRMRLESVRAHRMRAEVLLALKRLPEALVALDGCVRHGPGDAGVYRARADLRMQSGQYAGAQSDYTRALELDPEGATYSARGWAYLVADAPKLALPDFEKAIGLAPEQGDAYAGRGFARVLLGDYRPAVADAERALKSGPESTRLLYGVARIYAQAAGRLDREPFRYSRAAETTRNDWQVRSLRSLAQALEMQTPTEANDFWRNVVQTDKALEPVRRSPGYNHLAARHIGKLMTK